MRIAVFHDLPSGGAKRALREQIRGLTALGHRVDVFAPSTADEGFLPLDDIANSVEMFARPAPPDREAALESSAPVLAAVAWLRYLKRVRQTEREIAKAIDGGEYDVALIHPNQFTQAPWVLRFLRTPTIYYCHEPLRAAYEPRISPYPTRLAIRATLGGIDRRNARAATRMLVNSGFTRTRTAAVYGRGAEVNYLGVDIDRFQPSGAPPDEYVLTVAALHPLKGIDFLIEALSRVAPDSRPPLVVVSDRSREAERTRLVARAGALNVDLQFHFRVTESELVDLYSRARLVVYAPYDEPFGFVPLEAMAVGRPVLGVSEGGIPETIIDGVTGFLADRDPDAFGARIEELVTDRATADRVASQALKIVGERWRWDRSVEELAAFCMEAVADRE